MEAKSKEGGRANDREAVGQVLTYRDLLAAGHPRFSEVRMASDSASPPGSASQVGHACSPELQEEGVPERREE